MSRSWNRINGFDWSILGYLEGPAQSNLRLLKAWQISKFEIILIKYVRKYMILLVLILFEWQLCFLSTIIKKFTVFRFFSRWFIALRWSLWFDCSIYIRIRCSIFGCTVFQKVFKWPLGWLWCHVFWKSLTGNYVKQLKKF